MYSERLQILVSPEQRRRLEAEARAQGISVSAVVRQAINGRVSQFTREERMRAVEEVRQMRGGRYVSPEELDRIIEESRTEEILGELPGIPR